MIKVGTFEYDFAAGRLHVHDSGQFAVQIHCPARMSRSAALLQVQSV